MTRTKYKKAKKDALRAAFLNNQPFPVSLQQAPGIVRLWTYWRTMHLETGRELPPHIAPWSLTSQKKIER